MKIPTTILKTGSTGKLVEDLQRELKQAGFDPHGIDGKFGPKTKAALEAFQHHKHLKVDGVTDKQTWTALGGDRFEDPKKPAAHHPKPKPKPAPAKTPTSGKVPYGEPWKKGPGRLYGTDTSSYQTNAEFQKGIKNAKWAAIKATEGTSWNDPTFKARWNELGKRISEGKMKLRVAYHFMHAGDGTAQAKHFLHELGIKGKLPAGTRLALDWEAGSLKDPHALRDAANYIHKVTGLWPLIYTSQGELSRAHAAVPHAQFWDAKWTKGLSVHNEPFVQYGLSNHTDQDVFNGDLKALERFAGWAK
jgi:hypothetical protein